MYKFFICLVVSLLIVSPTFAQTDTQVVTVALDGNSSITLAADLEIDLSAVAPSTPTQGASSFSMFHNFVAAQKITVSSALDVAANWNFIDITLHTQRMSGDNGGQSDDALPTYAIGGAIALVSGAEGSRVGILPAAAANLITGIPADNYVDHPIYYNAQWRAGATAMDRAITITFTVE